MTDDSALEGIEVSDTELANLAGLTSRRIRQLAAEGKLTKIGRNKYALRDAVRALLANAAENNEGSQLQKEKLRKLKAEATMAELELAKQRSEVAPLNQIERALERTFAVVRTNMRAIPSRVVTQIIGETSEQKLKSALTREIDLALTALADNLLNNNTLADEDITDDDQDE
jgi:phage terminase Nu1 subunit (DNA packaging protein)